MRKRAFISALTAVTAAICIALTGCTADQVPLNDKNDQLDGLSDSDWQIHFNRETGKITAIFDHLDPTRKVYSDPTFDEKADLAFPFNNGNARYSDATTIDGTLIICEKNYPTTLTVSWSFGSTNSEQQAIYYNKLIASPETITELEQHDPAIPFSLTSTVLEFAGQGVLSNPMPTPRFTTTGEAIIHYGPDYLTQGYVNGIAPEDLVFQHTGTAPSSNAEYAYIFGCATYKITLANGDELQRWIDQLPVNSDGVGISFTAHADDAIVATDAPCDISQKELVVSGQSKDPNNGDEPDSNPNG